MESSASHNTDCSRAAVAAPDDSLGEAAPFNGLGRAQPLESASVETEVGGDRQHDFKNIGQFLWNVRIVCRGDLVGFLDELGAQSSRYSPESANRTMGSSP